MRLCINIDHIATLRNARGGSEPDPVEAAAVCERAGADGIVVHLREDRRHIKDDDVRRLRKTVTTKLDLEMGAADEIVGIALDIIPDLVTLVPEKRQELTTEGGLDVVLHKKKLTTIIKRFHDKNIPVSLFVDPIVEHIDIAKEMNADMVELHTGQYAEAKNNGDIKRTLNALQNAALYGKQLGLEVNAGHGLHYFNVRPIADISSIDEMSIGHSIISRSAFVGLEQAVKEMISAIK